MRKSGQRGCTGSRQTLYGFYESTLHILRSEATRWAGENKEARTVPPTHRTVEFRKLLHTVRIPTRSVSAMVDWDFVPEPVIATG